MAHDSESFSTMIEGLMFLSIPDDDPIIKKVSLNLEIYVGVSSSDSYTLLYSVRVW